MRPFVLLRLIYRETRLLIQTTRTRPMPDLTWFNYPAFVVAGMAIIPFIVMGLAALNGFRIASWKESLVVATLAPMAWAFVFAAPIQLVWLIAKLSRAAVD